MTRTTGNVVAGLLALALTAGLVVRTSSATFTAQTDNSGNSVAAGTVVLTDDDLGAATLQMTNIAPGESSVDCIEVTYGGTLDPEAVRVFSTSAFVTTGATLMEDQVNITIEEGTGDCTTFGTSTTLVNSSPLGTWDANDSDYATGTVGWDPVVGPETRPYRITLELDQSTGNAFQGASLDGISISWATQSTATPGQV